MYGKKDTEKERYLIFGAKKPTVYTGNNGTEENSVDDVTEWRERRKE
jgi:hypothetical protein